jgi:hypothetical protein
MKTRDIPTFRPSENRHLFHAYKVGQFLSIQGPVQRINMAGEGEPPMLPFIPTRDKPSGTPTRAILSSSLRRFALLIVPPSNPPPTAHSGR